MKQTEVSYNARKPFKILVAGGCYSGLAAALALLERCDSCTPPIPVMITIVDERDGFFHVIGTPLALASKSYAEKAWVSFKDITILQRPDVRFIHGSVVKVTCEDRVAKISVKGREVSYKYDFFISATGLRRAWPAVPQSQTREEYLKEAGAHIDSVTNSKNPILVIGGGAVGVEMAAELKICYPDLKVILAHSRDKILSAEPLPDAFKDRSLRAVQEAGVDVLLEHRLSTQTPVEAGYEVEFTNGEKLIAGVVIMAISKSVPTSSYLPKEVLDESGYVNVLPSLQLSSDIANAERHFAVGDIINWSGIKRCGTAMHMGKLAGFNVYQAIRGLGIESESTKKPKFKELRDIPPMITVAVGRTAVSCGPRGVRAGKRAMKLFFEEDLGFRIVWDYLRLGEEAGSILTWRQSAVNILMYMFPEVRSVWTKMSKGGKKAVLIDEVKA
ncbi:hypothetical protein BX600DRAFT_509393 [Xylariales sp. PMI_506]|nr:hypothetical protein BX600DRAFT_509393 [Xylariales sp. PMI_506]